MAHLPIRHGALPQYPARRALKLDNTKPHRENPTTQRRSHNNNAFGWDEHHGRDRRLVHLLFSRTSYQ